jgi:diguanylate cyclase (GGDEF)-like protein
MAKILAVDDQPDNLDLLAQILEENNHEVIIARNGNEAVEKAGESFPDVILLDIQMPGMDGFQTCEVIKKNEKTKDIPIIFLSAQTGEENVVKGLDLGAYDYITKPFNERELVSRVAVMLRIRAAEQKIQTMALTDTLTGLYNRRFLYQRFGEEVSRSIRAGAALSCFMIDIDYFKKINDTLGHDFGDFVLKKVADLLKENLRGYDAIVRYGGEEFFVLLPGADTTNAENVAQKIREKIKNYSFEKDSKQVNLTISVGVFGLPANHLSDDIDQYIKNADDALYKAKNEGRDKVVVFMGAF